MNLDDYQSTVTRVCLETEPRESDLEALGHRGRWLTYRSMVRARFERVVKTAFPRTTEALGDRFNSLFAAWLAEAPPSSPLFRILPHQFEERVLDGLEARLRDLMRYESAIWSLKAESAAAPEAVELSFDRPIALSPSLTLLDTEYAVHKTAPDEALAGQESGFHLLLYRTPEFGVVTLVLNPLARSLVWHFMQPHESLAAAVRAAAEEQKAAMGPKFMESIGGLLANYIERGIVLGSVA